MFLILRYLKTRFSARLPWFCLGCFWGVWLLLGYFSAVSACMHLFTAEGLFMSTSRRTLPYYCRAASANWAPHTPLLSSLQTVPVSELVVPYKWGCPHLLVILSWILHAGCFLVGTRLLNGNIRREGKKEVHSIRFVLNNKMLTKNDTVLAKRYTFEKWKGQTAPPWNNRSFCRSKTERQPLLLSWQPLFSAD